MSGLPDDAVGYRIAAIVPCLYHSDGPTTWCPRERPCDRSCRGDGTRVVITDVEVKQGSAWEHFVAGDGHMSMRARKDGWYPVREVES